MQYIDLIEFVGDTFQVPYAGDEFEDDAPENMIARVIDIAEQRIYAKMNFLATRQAKSGPTYVLTAGSRQFQLPSTCIIIEGIAAITPISATPETGDRNYIDRSSLDFIDFMYPNASTVLGVPKFWGPKTDSLIVFGPTPDVAYPVEVTGIFRPDPISQTNTSTYISLNYPQLLMTAVAISWTGYQRDFGAQSEDPKLALSWKVEFDSLIADAVSEEKRRRGLSEEASPTSPKGAGSDPGED